MNADESANVTFSDSIGSIEIADDAVAVDSSALTLVNDSAQRAAGTFVFTASDSAPSIAPQDVIVGAQKGGFLRRVTSVEQHGDTVTVQTTEAALTDAVNEGSFSLNVPVNLATGQTTSRGAARFGPTAVVATQQGVRATSTGVSLAHVILYDGSACFSATHCAHVILTLDSGIVAFSDTVNVGAQITHGQGVTAAHTIITGTLMLNAAVSDSMSGPAAVSGEVPLPFRLATPFYTQIGPVPVAGLVETTFVATFSAQDSGAIHASTGIQSSQSLAVGGRYEDGSWKPVFGLTPHYRGLPLTLRGNMALAERVSLRPEVTVWLYGVAGGFANIGPYLQLEGAVNSSTWTVELSAGLAIAIGMKLGILSEGLPVWSHDFASTPIVLVRDSGSRAVSTVSVSPSSDTLSVDSTRQLTATLKDSSGNILSGPAVTWASSNTSVATVNSTGLVTGVAAGTATITATSQGESGTATVTVLPGASGTGRGALLWLDLSAGSGTTLHDETGHGYDFTIHGATWGSGGPSGLSGHYLSLTGSDYLSLTSAPNGVKAISAWVTFQPRDAVMETSDTEFQYYWNDNNQLVVWMNGDRMRTTRTDFQPGQTYQLLAIVDGTSAHGIYIDGKKEALDIDDAKTSMTSFPITSSEGIYIGRSPNDATGGKLFQLAFFGYAPSAGQVASLYSDGNGMTYSAWTSGQ